MKFLCSILLLALLVSCSEEEIGSKTRTCTFNDQPVDCAVLDGTATASASELTVSASIGYEVVDNGDGYQVLILEEVNKEEVSGENTCSIDTRNANKIQFEVVQDGWVLRMFFEDGASTEDFQRVGAPNDGDELTGSWRAEASVGGQIDMVLTFNFKDDGTVVLSNNCKF